MSKAFICQFDIAQPKPFLWGVSGYPNAYVLIRNGQAPVDVLYIPVHPSAVAFSREQLENELDHHLGIAPAFMPGVPDSARQDVHVQPGISVVVCTRDRAQSLSRCLAALQKLAYKNFEVIVVDNASRDQTTKDLVAQTPFRYVREERPGLDWARNRGAQEARYEIVAYTDDDVCVDPGWLQGIAKAFSSAEVSGMTGLVLPGELETPAQNLFQIYSRGMSKGTQVRQFNGKYMTGREKLTTHFLGVGANMAFRRSLLTQLGGFDTALDVGTPSYGAGDLDMFHRVLMSGAVIRYEPRALVWHFDRRTVEGFRKQLYSNGRAFGVYLLKCFSRDKKDRGAVVDFAIGTWIPWLFGRVILRLRRRHRMPLRLLWAEVQGALDAPWAYFATYRHDRRLRSTHLLKAGEQPVSP